MGQKQKKIQQKLRKSDKTRQKNQRGDITEKWDQTDSPEISDGVGGGRHQNHRPHFGVEQVFAVI